MFFCVRVLVIRRCSLCSEACILSMVAYIFYMSLVSVYPSPCNEDDMGKSYFVVTLPVGSRIV